MSGLSSMTDDDDGGGPGEEIPLGRRTVQDAHRVSVPTDRLGLEAGDVVDVYFDPTDPDTEGFVEPGVPIRSGGRITIPEKRWKPNGISVGDQVDVVVRIDRSGDA